jgi:hypothetical protein
MIHLLGLYITGLKEVTNKDLNDFSLEIDDFCTSLRMDLISIDGMMKLFYCKPDEVLGLLNDKKNYI